MEKHTNTRLTFSLIKNYYQYRRRNVILQKRNYFTYSIFPCGIYKYKFSFVHFFFWYNLPWTLLLFVSGVIHDRLCCGNTNYYLLGTNVESGCLLNSERLWTRLQRPLFCVEKQTESVSEREGGSSDCIIFLLHSLLPRLYYAEQQVVMRRHGRC